MDQLFQDRQYENTLCKIGLKHTLSTTHVYLETLENSTEQSKEAYEAGRTGMGGI